MARDKDALARELLQGLLLTQTSAARPDPEGYLVAAQALEVKISRCLVVEDSVPGVAAGRAAGATVASL